MGAPVSEVEKAHNARGRVRSRAQSEDSASRKANNCFIHPHIIYSAFLVAVVLFFSVRWVVMFLTGSEPIEIEETSKAALRATESALVTFLLGDVAMMLEVMSIITFIVVTVRYTLAIRARGRRAEYITNSGPSLQHLIPFGRGESVFDHDYVSTLPKVALVLAVKFHASVASVSPKENWKSQLGTMYGGQMEAIFAVETEDDGAVPIIREIQEELKDRVTVKLAVAGLSGGDAPELLHSQKIHNQLAALKLVSEDCKYVLFVDMGCRMNPGTLQALVHEMETDQRCFVATGFPFDVPPPQATIWAWTLCQFRYLIMTDFLTNRSTFVWGGTMLLRKADIDNNKYNILDHWSKGGYSDDTTVQACAQDNGRTIATPLEAVFAHPVRGDMDLWNAWDFLHRQNFVLTTYVNLPSRIRHYVLFFLYGVGAVAVSIGNLLFASKMLLFAYDYTLIKLHVFSFVTTMTILLTWSVMVLIQHHNLTQVVALINALSPQNTIDIRHMSHWVLWWSNALHGFLAAAAGIRNFCCNHVTWRGIKYRIENGGVVEVIHGAS